MNKCGDYDNVDIGQSIIENDRWRKSHIAVSVNYLDLEWRDKAQCVNNFWKEVRDYRGGRGSQQYLYNKVLAQKRKRSLVADLPIFIPSADIRCFKDPAGKWEFVDIEMVCTAIATCNSKFESYFAYCDVDQKKEINESFKYYMMRRNAIKDISKYF